MPSLTEIPASGIFDALPAAYTTDAEGRIQYYNRAAVALWGRAPILGDERWCGSQRLFHPCGRPMPHAECPMARALQSGESIAGAEGIAERPDGSRVTFLAYPALLRDASGAIVGAVNMLLDITERKSFEDTLRRRDAELTDFVESTTIGLHWVGPDGTILWANRAEMDMLGYTEAEYIGRHVANFHADSAVIREVLDRLANNETIRDQEARLRCKDGSIKHVLIDTSAYMENGAFVHTRCFTRDITAQKQVERRLAMGAAISQILSESNALDEAAPRILETVSDYFDAGIAELWMGEETLRCTAFHTRLSGKAARQFGKSARALAFAPGQGLPGRVWQARQPVWLGDVADDPHFARRDAAAGLGLGAAVGIPILFAGRCLGVITWFMRAPLAPDSSLLDMLSSTGQKIGQFIERTRAEEANRYLASVVEASPDAIISTTMDGVITSWNTGAERLFGYTAEEAVGGPMSLVLPKTRANERLRNIAKLKKGAVIAPYETVRLNKAGTLIPVSVSFSGIHDSAGKLVGTAAIVRDIAAQKAAETQLESRIRQLEALSGLCLLVLTHDDLQGIFDDAVRRVAGALDVELAKVLELQPGRQDLLLRAGVGWRKGLVGKATIGMERTSQAGYTLTVNRPVVVENLKRETRFNGPKLLHDHGVVSGLSVIIQGEDRKPFGVLGAHAKTRREFTANDVHFFQSVANILAIAIEVNLYEERQAMLTRELTHRVKNILSVIQAMAWVSGKQATSVETFMRSFEGRLSALAHAHDLLTEGDWAGASLCALSHAVLGGQADRTDFSIDLEDVILHASGAQAVSLLLHELTTNAVKYGALSNRQGRVSLEGRFENKDGEAFYRLSWRESGGPPVTRPDRHGFGSKLVTRTVQDECRGGLSVDWHPDGLVFQCTLQLASVADLTRQDRS